MKAGDFVEYIKQKTDESGTYGEDTLLYNTATKNYEAVLLSENRVAIGSVNNSGSLALHVTICEFNDMTIQVVCSERLYYNSSSSITPSFSMCALNENKFCVFYMQGSIQGIQYIICEIANNEIIFDKKNISFSQTLQRLGNFIALSENRIVGICLISNFVNIVTISINGNNFVVENKYELTGQQGLFMRLEKLNNDKFLAMIYVKTGSRTNDIYLFTIGEDTFIINDHKQYDFFALSASIPMYTSLKLNYNKVILFASSTSDIDAVIININTEIIDSVSSTRLISNIGYAGFAISPVVIDSNNVLLLHSLTANKYLYSLQCNIQENEITVSTDTQISATPNSGASISNIVNEMGLTFIAHSFSTSNYLHGMIYDPKIEELAQKVQNKQSTIARHSKNKCYRRTTRASDNTNL